MFFHKKVVTAVGIGGNYCYICVITTIKIHQIWHVK